ncbi:MAG: fibronectin type III domain-containing protein [Streptosporangiaceae bacterium]
MNNKAIAAGIGTLALAAGIGLSACGGGGSSTTTAPGPPAGPAPASAATSTGSSIAPPTSVQETNTNGSATVSWQPSVAGVTVTGYRVSLIPTYTDRVPAPNLEPNGGVVSDLLPATARTHTFSGLLEDCHQRYEISVQTVTAGGLSSAVATQSFRPSGNVAQGQAPPYVVVLVDGILSQSPGFSMNPYNPDSGIKSYCPESWWPASSGHGGKEAESGFWGSPKGPWSFFHKWNVGEINSDGSANTSNFNNEWESEPKVLNGNGGTGSFTHDFMLDDLAAQGAVILPFSYDTKNCHPSTGAQLTGSAQNPTFSFPGYSSFESGITNCDVTHIGGFGGGFGFGPGVNYWGSVLDSELASIHRVWPTSKVVVIGHSQGGLIVTDAWLQGFNLPHVAAFSLDSPINGSCGTPGCIGPIGYPPYNQRTVYDEGSNGYLGIDQSQGNPMHFIGTYGDSPLITLPGPPSCSLNEFDIEVCTKTTIHIHSYDSGSQTLEHQLPFDYASDQPFQVEQDCNVEAQAKVNSQCPAPNPPDHISRCSVDYFGVAQWIQDTGHFVVKYCPDVINYINGALGLSESPSPRPSPNPVPANPPANAVAAWKAAESEDAYPAVVTSLKQAASLLPVGLGPVGDDVQIADLNQLATLPLAELDEGTPVQQAEGLADMKALNGFFNTSGCVMTACSQSASPSPSPSSPSSPSSSPSPSPSPFPSPGNDSPEDAADGFYQGELDGDWSAVCSYVTPAAQGLCLAGTSGQGAATGEYDVRPAVISGSEALVPVTGSICAPGSPCVTNFDAGLGMPSPPSQFSADYQAAVANSTSSSTTAMSPVPCSQVNGNWYVDLG